LRAPDSIVYVNLRERLHYGSIPGKQATVP
jgi:hypothetical protein